ncbi:cupin domain-containing protein [Sphingomonas sp.]|uniref:cupin domain-containing protein n=1 Tax=Sphingomonas sp. TaxID=28214 RepID=UPI0025EF7782|nr:cupin domain-containing protein [Sphingomonas sp.]
MPTHILPEAVPPVIVGPGCVRRDLPTAGGVRAWIVEMEPGAEWPHVDQHDQYGEEVLILSGDMIEGDRVFGAGSYLVFGPNSSHRPRTETGVRMFGINVTGAPAG